VTVSDPHLSVGPGARVGERCTLHSGVSVGASVSLGDDTQLHAGVVVYPRCSIGARCTLHANVVIGADGFGYRPAPDARSILKVPHIGTVEIHDDVEIGASTTIDRAKFGATVIGSGTKIDNLVQIGHNVRVGRSCIICGCAALAGSVVIGDGATIAGGVGIADNITIGAGAKVGARSGVMDDVPPGESWVGYPAKPARQTFRILTALNQLPDVMSQVKKLLKQAE
jgi:UDP-3-O-[3-hydroxymyristoyl] glucosamine N-acyltransferase